MTTALGVQRAASRLAVLAMAAVLASCGGSPASPAGPATPAPTAGATASPDGTASEPPLPADIPVTPLTLSTGDVIGRGEVTPEGGGEITGTTADGLTYTLSVDPEAVTEPVTVELRPLAGTSGLGKVVAGVDFAPAGLRLHRPAILTIEGLDVPATVAAFEYRGAASGASARLVIGPAVEDRSLAFSVSHFSGSVAVDVGSDANQLFDKWSTAKGDDTPTGRQAAAETRYAAAELAERTGHISADTASEIQGRALEEWMQAESDRLMQNPDLARLADAGDPRDLDTLGAELDRMLTVERQRQLLGDETASEGLAKAVEISARYEAAITKNIVDSKRIQDASKSGLMADAGEILDLFQTITGLDRQIQLLGGPPSDGLTKVVGLLANLRTALVASCKQAPLDPLIVLQLERVVQLLGAADAVSIADILACVHDPSTPAPPAAARAIDGTITYDARIGSGDTTDTYHVVVNAVIRENPRDAQLVFASGSTLTVDWSGPAGGPVDCPGSGSWTTPLGTLNGEAGWNPLSDPRSGAHGLVLDAGATLRVDIGFNRVDLAGDCFGQGLTLSCPTFQDRLVGNLVGTAPKDWSFSCSTDSPDFFSSVGGHFVQVRG